MASDKKKDDTKSKPKGLSLQAALDMSRGMPGSKPKKY